MDNSSYFDTLVNPSAERIESLAVSGQPEVLFDGRAEIEGNIADFNQLTRREYTGAGGCSNTGSKAHWILALAPMLLGLRRR